MILNKPKQSINGIIILLLLGFNLFLIYNLSDKRRDILNQSQHHIELSTLNDNLIDYIFAKGIIDTNSYSIDLKDEIDKNTLIFYFPENNCASCIINEAGNIKSKIKNLNNVMILADFASDSDLRYFFESHEINGIQYSNWNKQQINPKGHKKEPYYFVLKKGNYISMQFTPEKELNCLTIKYLETVDQVLQQ